MDRDNERADRRETGREGLHHHEEGTERDLRSTEEKEAATRKSFGYRGPKKSLGLALESAKPVR
jgi:hypothetical protein